jgi:replicative DNA helicase
MMKREHGIDILWIDHIQLIKPYELPHSNRNNTMAVYSQSIVALAKSLDIPIICLSQLSRDAEKGVRTPRLSDLRDSGTLEQDARQVLLLYQEKETFKLEIAKNNFGSSGNTVEMIRHSDKQRFEEVAPITQKKAETYEPQNEVSIDNGNLRGASATQDADLFETD